LRRFSMKEYRNFKRNGINFISYNNTELNIMKNMIKNLTLSILIIIVCSIFSGAVLGQSTLDGHFLINAPESSVFRVNGASNLNGKIKIISTQSGDIEVIFKKMAKASSRSEEKRFLNLIDLRLTPVSEDRTDLIILSPSHAPWEGTNHQIKLEIIVKLPEQMMIEGRGKFLNFDISGPFKGIDLDCEFTTVRATRIFGTVDILTTEEDVSLKAIKGSVKVETIHGNITASDIIIPSGYAVFTTEQGTIELDNIQGSVEAYTAHAEINVRDIDASDGSIVLRTNYSPVKVEDVSGALICETNYSPIVIKGLVLNHGESKIETSYSPIEVEITEILDSDIYIENNYQNITLKIPQSSSVRLYGSVNKGGQIRARDLNILPVLLEPNRLEGTLESGVSRIEAKVTGVGDIFFEGY